MTRRATHDVIEREGQRTVITGWRAWLIVGPAVLLVAVLMVVVVTLLMGVALTVGTLILFGAPLAIVLVVRLLLGRRR